MMTCNRRVSALFALHLTLIAPACAGETRAWFVDIEQGDDRNSGEAAAPLAMAQRAVDLAQPGDTIHLLPEGAVYRQMILLRGKSGLTIEGHGVTLTGADPLPADGWEEVSAGMHRRRLACPRVGKQDRHILVLGGRAQRMGRSPTARPDFPPPEQLEEGQFTWQPIDDKTGWLYVRGPVDGLEWAVRMAGLATSGHVRDVTVRNLHARHALNDGFNIHGDARGMRFSHISGYENYDEGFSAHDTCQCWIEHGRFWGNDNAVYDVNTADTYYLDCEFRDSVSVEVGFQGGDHRLDQCRIVALARSALRLSAGQTTDGTKTTVPGVCRLTGTTIRAKGDSPCGLEIGADCTAELADCVLEGVAPQVRGSATSLRTRLNGRPWTP